MNRLVQGLLLSALPLTAALSTPAPSASPLGPGGVAHAVTQLCAAIDAGDAGTLGDLLVAGDPGLVLGIDADGGLSQLDDVTVAPFLDVDASGAAVEFAGADDYVAGLTGAVRAAKGGLELMRTEIRAVYANCASERCSWGMVDLVREYGKDGKVQQRVPLRATALMRYTPQGFRIFHWHASRAATASKTAR